MTKYYLKIFDIFSNHSHTLRNHFYNIIAWLHLTLKSWAMFILSVIFWFILIAYLILLLPFMIIAMFLEQ